MKTQKEILKNLIYDQISVEENICCLIEEKISTIEDSDFIDVKDLLMQIGKIIENHYTLLNTLVIKLEEGELSTETDTI